jgi:anti-sigma factor RsiW
MREMPCQELVEVVTDYLEGALPLDDLLRFEAHLAECPPCREYLEQFRRTISIVGRIDPAAVSERSREQLLAAFRGWRANWTDEEVHSG